MNKLSRSIPFFLFLAFLLMSFSGCSQKEAAEDYNITGKWSVTFNWGWEGFAREVTFNGSKQSGSLTDIFGNSGTYTVNDKSASWTYTEFSTTYTGSFSSTSAMSGTMKQTYEGQTYSGTWTASKKASASVLENILFNRQNVIVSRLGEMAGFQTPPRKPETSPVKQLGNDQEQAGPYFSVETFSPPADLKGTNQFSFPIDFDNDGVVDIVSPDIYYPKDKSQMSPTPINAYHNDGQGHFTEVTGRVFNQDKQVFMTRGLAWDFNRDGRKDLFLGDHGSDYAPWDGAQNQIFIQSADGRLVNETSSRLPSINDFTHSSAMADIDGDGDYDIYAGNVYCTTSEWPYLLINDGNANFTKNEDRLPNFVTNPDSANGHIYPASCFVDVDLDGDQDLVLGQTPHATSKWFEKDIILINDGTGRFSHGSLACAGNAFLPLRYGGNGWGTSQVVSGDFNRDGWPDLIMDTTPEIWTNVIFQLLLNNGDGTFSDATSRFQQIPNRGGGVPGGDVVVDFNSDGWPDFYTFDPGRRSYIFLNQKNANFSESWSALGIPDISFLKAVPFDVDNDGDIDLVGFGGWPYRGYVLRNLSPYPVR